MGIEDLRKLDREFLRGFGLPQLVIVVLSSILAVSIVLFARNEQNAMQGAQEAKLAERAINAIEDRAYSDVISYAMWSQTAEAAVMGFDPKWLDANVGSYIYGTLGYEYSFVVRHDGKTIYSSYLEDRANLDALAKMGEPLRRAMTKLEGVKADKDARLSGLARLDGMPVAFSIALIMPDPTDQPTFARWKKYPRAFLVFVKPLNAAMMADIEKNYGLASLHVARTDAALLPLEGFGGGKIGGLAWTPRMAGNEIAWFLLPIVFFGIAIVALFAWFVLSRAWTTVERLRQADRQLAAANEETRKTLEAAIARVQEENAELNRQAEQSTQAVQQAAARERKAAAEEFRQGALAALDRLRVASTALGDESARLNEAWSGAVRTIDGVSGSVTRTMHDIHSLAPTMNQLAGLARSNAQGAGSTLTKASEAQQRAQVSSQALASLTEALGRIDEFTNGIGDISGQTNLLALNATIEAARAGEYGKGFSVVANEVKHLANRSAELSQKVSAETGQIQNRMTQSVDVVGQLGADVGSLVAFAKEVARSANEQETALSDVERLVLSAVEESQRVAISMGDMSQVTGESHEATQRVSHVAQTVRQRTDELRESVNSFLAFLDRAA